MNAITLRDACFDDAPLILDVIQKSFEEYRGRLEPASGAHSETIASILKLLETERCLLALRAGFAVGCVFYTTRSRLTDGEVYLHRLGVLPEARRAHIGSALVAAVEERARALGVEWVALGVRIALPANRRFYETIGYRVAAFGAHPGAGHSTFATMRKRVGPAPVHAVRVEQWSPHWAEQFQEAACEVLALLAPEVREVHHIGSTAVPGLAAKPTIDLLGIVRDIERVDARDEAMLAAGWQPWGEHGTLGRRFYRKGDDTCHTHHLHVFARGHAEIEAHLSLVAFLRAFPDEAGRYARLKLRLAAAHPWQNAGYMDGKARLVEELRERALFWARAHPQHFPT